MHFSKRRGFTLVELLVVIGIIGILAAILIPAVNTATGIARRNSCLTNQRTWAQAMSQHVNEKQYYPGYVNKVRAADGATEFAVSWMVKLLPYVEQGNLYTNILEDPTIVVDPNFNDPRLINLEVATCASDPAEVEMKGRSSYIVNTGVWDGEYSPQDTSPDTKANGVCHDLRRSNQNRVDNAYISKNDGLSNTLLISENVNAFGWFATEETVNGMVWVMEEWVKNEAPNMTPQGHEAIYAINKGYIFGGDSMLVNASAMSGEDWLKFARPSSQHSGGVNVMFCDEHGRFLSEEIDWTVYKRLLTTNEADAMHLHGEGDLTPQAKLKWRLPLSTEDLEP